MVLSSFILITVFILIISFILGNIINRYKENSYYKKIYDYYKIIIVSVVISIIALINIYIGISIFMIYLILLIYRNTNVLINVFKKASISITIFMLITAAFYIYQANKMPFMLEASKDYISDINLINKSNNTKVKLKKVFLDLKSINATYSVRGPERVVAIELKKNIYDEKPIASMSGLWVGDRILGQSSFLGFNYKAEEFLDTLYLIFYLSDGSNIPFEIKDKNNINSLVKFVNIDKKILYNNGYFEIKSLSKGLNYTSIDFTSSFNPGMHENIIIAIELVVDDTILKSSSSFYGGGNEYSGSYSFSPINSDNIKIKVTHNIDNKIDYIDLFLK